jgi:alkanesulfonate monooxygenase SsuD/methylene tetrahydromethanopterin reductase-like flavin-dependent oxidoreductase (luciferase family)
MAETERTDDRYSMYNNNAFKLGLFGANCSSGRAITKVPERWSGNWPDNLALARMADEAGIDFLLPIGRWKGYGGETNYQGETYETVTWATGLLAATQRITVFATVHAPLLHPVFAAKQFVTADHISQGRFGLNIVCGWNEGEFKMFGATQRDHEGRYEYGQEWIDVLRLIWQSDEPFDYQGRHLKLEGVRADPKPFGGTQPLIMNAGASPIGQAFAVKNCDALFSTPRGAETIEELADGIQHAKDLAARDGRKLDVYSVGVVTCRPTMEEAKDYHRHCIIDDADWDAVDNILAMKDISTETVGAEVFERRRRHQAHGMGGIPIVGDPDFVVGEITRMANAGLRGIGISFVNYLEELPYFCDEVLPRLERLGLRQKRS